MRKTLITLAFAAALPSVTMAGSEAYPHGGANSKIERTLDDLDLSKAQSKAIAKIEREEFTARNQIIKQYLAKLPEAEKAAMHKEVEATKTQREKAVREQLTPEQRTQYDEKLQKEKALRAEWLEFHAWKKAQQDKKAAAKPEEKPAEQPAAPAEAKPEAKQ